MSRCLLRFVLPSKTAAHSSRRYSVTTLLALSVQSSHLPSSRPSRSGGSDPSPRGRCSNTSHQVLGLRLAPAVGHPWHLPRPQPAVRRRQHVGLSPPRFRLRACVARGHHAGPSSMSSMTTTAATSASDCRSSTESMSWPRSCLSAPCRDTGSRALTNTYIRSRLASLGVITSNAAASRMHTLPASLPEET